MYQLIFGPTTLLRPDWTHPNTIYLSDGITWQALQLVTGLFFYLVRPSLDVSNYRVGEKSFESMIETNITKHQIQSQSF